jgi:hypothetical protein
LGNPKTSDQLLVVSDVNLPVTHDPRESFSGSTQNASHRIAVGAKRSRELQQSKSAGRVQQMCRQIRGESLSNVARNSTLAALPDKAEQRCDNKQR